MKRLGLLLLVGGLVFGIGGCSDTKTPTATDWTVDDNGNPVNSTPPATTPAAAALAFEKVVAISDGTDFILKGFVRNTGTKTEKFGVSCSASERGIAVLGPTVVPLAVADLGPGLASFFSTSIPVGTHTKMTWKYHGIIGTAPQAEHTITADGTITTPPGGGGGGVMLRNVKATYDIANDVFCLSGTLSNTLLEPMYFSVGYRAAAGEVALETGWASLDQGDLAPGLQSDFEQCIDAAGHTKVTWKYWADYSGGPDTEYSISYP